MRLLERKGAFAARRHKESQRESLERVVDKGHGPPTGFDECLLYGIDQADVFAAERFGAKSEPLHGPGRKRGASKVVGLLFRR